MIVHEERAFFHDRSDAGKRLAEKLAQYRGEHTVVFAIPRGGVPVAVEVAGKLGSSLDIVVVRKIPIPDNPEAGYGSVTEDGTIVLNELMVKDMGLNCTQIEHQAEKVRAEIARRSKVFRKKLPAVDVEAKTAIVIDDGLASGYTMLAAIKSIKQRKATRVVVAVPVASGSAYDLVKPAADDLVCLVIARVYQFAVASFYARWHDLTDAEVLQLLNDWHERQARKVSVKG